MHKSKGTAIWFKDAADEMGADVMRWIFCSQETTSNLSFGFGVAKEVRGKFFNTLWNTYGFFVNYARIINFIPPETPTPIAERSDFDRWILSNLQLTIQKVRKGIENHNIRSSVKVIDKFIVELSNWYIRHCRRRFWRGDDDADARLAYETLYESLVTLTKVLSPIIPFITEEIFQNLVRSHDESAPESIHHTDFPVAKEEWIDEQLSQHMDAIIHMNWLALSARELARIKVRQPLAEMQICPSDEMESQAANRFKSMLMDDLNVKKVTIHPVDTPNPCGYTVRPNFKTLGKKFGKKLKGLQSYIKDNGPDIAQMFKDNPETITLTVNDEDLLLGKEDLKMELVQPENLSVAEDKGVWVSFDTRISEDLRREGMMRDLLRRLQVLRKEVKLEIEDTIVLTWSTASEDFRKIMDEWKDFLAAELLCTEIKSGELSADEKTISLGDDNILVHIEKSGKLKS